VIDGQLMKLRLFLTLTLFMGLLAEPEFARADSEWQTKLAPFLQRHCMACHSGENPEGNLNLKTGSVDLQNAEVRQRWVYLHDRVAQGEMPPKTEEQPNEAAKLEFLKVLGDALIQADLVSREVILRRLNRNEYENTVRDLFGIYVELQNVLPDDSPEQGFDTVGSVLSISTEQMMSYIEAADLVLDEVFGPPDAPRRVDETVNIKDLRSTTTADRITPEGVVLFSGAKSLPMYGVSVRGPALYRLRIQAKAIQSDRPVIMCVEGGVTGRIPSHIAGFFEVPPDVEFA
jgi:hypothetical protein